MILGRPAASGVIFLALCLAALGCSGDDGDAVPDPESSTNSTTTTTSTTSTTPPPSTTTSTTPPDAATATIGEVFTDPSEVRDLAADAEGRIWAVGPGGAARYDPTTEEVVVLTTNNGLPANEVHSVVVADDGVVWLGTAGGLASVDGAEVTDHGAPPPSTAPEEGIDFDPGVHGVTIGPDGAVWAYHAPDLVRFDGRRWEVLAFLGGAEFFGFAAQPEVAVTPDGVAWVTGVIAGVASFPGDLASLSNVARVEGSTVEAAGSFTGARTVSVGPDGAVWVTASEGVGRLLDGEWTVWPVPGRGIGDITVADDGTPWVMSGDITATGGEAYASRFDGTEWQLVHTAIGPGLDEDDVTFGLVSGDLPVVVVDGDVWSSAGDGLFGWRNGEQVNASLRTSLFGNEARAIDIADDGTVWALTDRAVMRHSGTGWSTLPYRDDARVFGDDLAAVSGSEAWALIGRENPFSQLTHVVGDRLEVIEDPAGEIVRAVAIKDVDIGADGTVWLATDGGPARLVDGEVDYTDVPLFPRNVGNIVVAADGTPWAEASGKVLSFGDGAWEIRASSDFGVNAAMAVTDEAVWTAGYTLNRFDLASQGWTVWETLPGSDFVNATSVAVGPDGAVWAGLFGRVGGLSPASEVLQGDVVGVVEPATLPTGLLTLTDDTWVRIDHPALGSETSITDLAFAPDGSLWVATRTGLVRLPPDVL